MSPMGDEPIKTVLARISATVGQWGRETTLEQMRQGFADLVSGGGGHRFARLMPTAYLPRGSVKVTASCCTVTAAAIRWGRSPRMVR